MKHNSRLLMLHYEEMTPALPLQEYIECYWTLITDFSLEQEICLPEGSVSLIFNFGMTYQRAECHHPKVSSEVGRISLTHQGKTSYLIDQQAPIRMLGVRFKPFGMAPFLGVSMVKYPPPFVIQGEKLTSWFGDFAQVMAADSFPERQIALEALLIKVLTKSQPPDPLVKEAVTLMVKSKGNIKISELNEQLHVSKSNMEKKFQEHVGLSPKILSNILRFNSIIYSRQQDPVPSLTELTYKQGFFDQSHLVHNFRSFTGLPPGRFFRRENRLIEMLRQSFAARTMEIY